MPNFVHLHVHSEFSLLDGLGHVSDMARRAAELGMPALALTDHGVMYGVVDFFRACKKEGIKPIIGMEAYLAARGMRDRDPQKDKSPAHLVLLAENQTGYRNLLKIATASQLEGFYYKPRVDKDFLAAHAGGLIALTACNSGEIPRYFLRGQPDKAHEAARWYRDVFGSDNFFIEVQSHEGIPETAELNRQMVALARELGVGVVATNDSHYIRAEDADAQDILLCIQTGKVRADPERMRMTDRSYYLKSAEEMVALFPELPEALENTLRIAERCEVNLESEGYHLPVFPVPQGYTPESYLRHLVEEGFRKRYPDADDARWERLNYELSVIHEMGFDTYFLILWDLCEYAVKHNIWWNVRGSGASSVVAYSLGITRLDPLIHNLIFERFLNPERVTMPDVDLDYPDDRRQEMIEYTRRKYGSEKVANIITFGTLGARAAVRDVGRVLDIPPNEVDQVAKMVPSGPKVHLRDAFENPEFKELYESAEYIHEWIDMALKVEGMARHASVHAAGVVIADKPLVEYIPLARAPKGDSDMAVTQFPMLVVESIGLLKLDFLGLATLTQMRKAAEWIETRHGIRLDLENIPTDDPLIFDLLTNGEVVGVFQVESEGMKKTLAQMRPTCMEDIIAVVALYRPGPMQFIESYCRRKHGEERVEYIHPALEPILKETYGVIVYQEQIIRILRDLAGYSGGEADVIRRAVSKKKEAIIAEHRVKFREGCVANGIPPEKADEIYAAIEYFANYGFNKAHAADYAMITCQTAYLKAHYPVEYMTALLSVEKDNTDKVAVLLAECRRLGIPVLPPDVNYSDVDFTIEDMPPEAGGAAPRDDSVCRLQGGAIRFGLGGIKNVGDAAVQEIIRARKEGGPFASLDDFCERVDLRKLNRRVLECLIRVGALDRFGSRAQLLKVVDQMMAVSAQVHQAREIGQLTMFGLFGGEVSAPGSIVLPQVEDVSRREKLNWEKELLGFYVSEHPLSQLVENLRDTITCLCGSINEEMDGKPIVVAGMVEWVRPHVTKKGDQMAFVHIEDIQGSVEVVVFPRLYKETREVWQEGRIVIVHGRAEVSRGTPKIICERVETKVTVMQLSEDGPSAAVTAQPVQPPPPVTAPAGNGENGHPRHLKIVIHRTADHERDLELVEQAYELLKRRPGHDRFTFIIVNGRQRVEIEFPNQAVAYTPELDSSLRAMLGSDALQIAV